MEQFSPMMRQYLEIKKHHKDKILFFRLGDFYEMFFDDAVLVSKELGLSLTGRNCGSDERAPMCGVPHHSCEAYIARLISKGYKVAMCEQKGEDNSGIVKREVTRVITPGTVLEDSMLDESKENFLCSCFFGVNSAALCFCDISTGSIRACEFSGEVISESIKNEIRLLLPREVLIAGSFPVNFIKFIKEICSFEICEPSPDFEATEHRIIEHFKNQKLRSMPLLVQCIGILFEYLDKTNKSATDRLRKLETYNERSFLALECGAAGNLELFETIRTKERKGSLIWVLDKTKTAMGKRMLRFWLERPLRDSVKINERLEALEEIYSKLLLMEDLSDLLSGVNDVERLMSKIELGYADCRDIRCIANTIQRFSQIKTALKNISSKKLISIRENIDELEDVYKLIETFIVQDSTASIKDGGVIKKGCNEELDRTRFEMNGSEEIIAKMEGAERQKTSIPKLKIGFNRIFGYYIEVSASYKDKVPTNYVRKQTLSGKERYVTDELKIIEARILSARERALELENEIFEDVRKKICKQISRISISARMIAQLDVIRSFSEVSTKNNYSKPQVDCSDDLIIVGGFHPVVERLVSEDAPFIPNDTCFNSETRAMVITGPNMAGKSTYMRQIALIAIMAQAGCFVPAKTAKIGIIDGVFTRIGASDDVSSGKSTFMVEMSEAAQIINEATDKSLILLDEIGRGTSTFDGLSIAQAVLEFCAEKIRAKTLFSTHYRELGILEQKVSGVKNYQFSVSFNKNEIIFLRKLLPGAASESFGISAARLAGLSERVVYRAEEILKTLNSH
ncbi:MAG: DNA mismatch repair protein MutS [Oscillospiraceae bacterium]|nr:DNA mismatch repair protein MutS [Oscillospiraceae bacterium]